MASIKFQNKCAKTSALKLLHTQQMDNAPSVQAFLPSDGISSASESQTLLWFVPLYLLVDHRHSPMSLERKHAFFPYQKPHFFLEKYTIQGCISSFATKDETFIYLLSPAYLGPCTFKDNLPSPPHLSRIPPSPRLIQISPIARVPSISLRFL